MTRHQLISFRFFSNVNTTVLYIYSYHMVKDKAETVQQHTWFDLCLMTVKIICQYNSVKCKGQVNMKTGTKTCKRIKSVKSTAVQICLSVNEHRYHIINICDPFVHQFICKLLRVETNTTSHHVCNWRPSEIFKCLDLLKYMIHTLCPSQAVTCCPSFSASCV